MSIKQLEKEFSEFCALISVRELEQNPNIKTDISRVRQMIEELRNHVPEKKSEIQSMRHAWVMSR